MCHKKQSHRQSMRDTIIILSISALLVILEVVGIFVISSTRTMSKIISLNPEEIKEIEIRYGTKGSRNLEYIIDDPEEIREVVEHVNNFVYSYKYYTGPVSGGSWWMRVVCYQKKYVLQFSPYSY